MDPVDNGPVRPQFGLSNVSPAGVQKIYDLASSKKYVLPTIYQGNYNPISRHIELDLIRLLRKLNISFYVYSPLAGGFLAKSAQELKGDMKGLWNRDTEVGQLYHSL
jgi:aflatoxin B1 aldehyde reductase